MKKKLGLLSFVVAVIALASMGMSYATEDYAAFIGCGFWDNEVVKDVGIVYAYIDVEGNLTISVSNAYPHYEAYVNFTIKNTAELGSGITIYVTKIDIANIYAGTIMDITVTYLNGNPIPVNAPIDPGEKLEGLVTITMLDGAKEGKSYSFGVDIEFSDTLTP